MPINSFLYPAPTNSNPYEVDNSLRFDDGSSDSLAKSFGSAGNRSVWTWSAWLKFSTFDSFHPIFTAGNWSSGSTATGFILYQGSFYSYWNSPTGGTATSGKYRDTSAWYHVVLQANTSTLKLYVNSEEQTSRSISGSGEINNSSSEHGLGKYSNSTSAYFDGYMAEVCFIDGQALDPTSFGKFAFGTNIWIPKDLSTLTFGTNGFYLDFENSSSLGADVSGNGNNFTVNNLTSVDQSTDTCTNNFATMNSLILGSGTTLSEGNLQLNPGTNSTGFHSASTMGVSTGKWYWEAKLVSGTKGAFGIIFDGSSGNVFEHQRNNKMPGGFSGNANSWGYKPGNSGNVENNAADISFSGVTATSSNILGFAMDLDNGALYIHKDGTYMNSGNPTSGSSKTGAIDISGGEAGFVFPAYGDSDTGASPSAAYNFGSPPYSESGGNYDAEGHGNFNQSVPSGYFAICSKNLAEYG